MGIEHNVAEEPKLGVNAVDPAVVAGVLEQVAKAAISRLEALKATDEKLNITEGGSSSSKGTPAKLAPCEENRKESQEVLIKKTLKPGKLGIDVHKEDGTVAIVNAGQCRHLGIQVGWTFVEIDGEPYTRSLLHKKVAGTTPYEASFLVKEEEETRKVVELNVAEKKAREEAERKAREAEKSKRLEVQKAKEEAERKAKEEEEKRRVERLEAERNDAEKKTKEVLQSVLDAETRLLKDPAYTVAVSELADSSVNFIVRPWVNSGDYWPTYWALLENIKIALDDADITIPFPNGCTFTQARLIQIRNNT